MDEVLKNKVHIETSSAYDIDIVRSLEQEGMLDKQKYIVCNGYKMSSYLEKIGYTSAIKELDAPHGEWNTLEIYVVGNNSVHVVNGEVVMVVENAKKPDGSILNIPFPLKGALLDYKNAIDTHIFYYGR